MTTYHQSDKKRIALLGGDEFSPNCEPIDGHLLNNLAIKTPKIAIIPTAVGHLKPQMTIAKAIAYFETLGAQAYGIAIHNRSDANNIFLINELLHSDVIYLTGGDPLYLLRSIENSVFLSTLTDMSLSGHMIVGSSAGAMVLCESMQVPPGSGDIIPGLNLVPNLRILPHYENLKNATVSGTDDMSRELSTKAKTKLLGIDSRTALFLYGSKCTVLGNGYVTVIDDEASKEYASGASLNNLL